MGTGLQPGQPLLRHPPDPPRPHLHLGAGRRAGVPPPGDPADSRVALRGDRRGASVRLLQRRDLQRPGPGHGPDPALDAGTEERRAGGSLGAMAVPAGETVIRLDPTAFIAPGAVVLGDVTLGPQASVWYGCVLRGDMDRIVVGERTNLQDGTIVHVDTARPALIGARVGVGHRAIIHGCTIEDDCLIGMGSILLNGVQN